jgi:hypothetical protein
MRRWRDTGHLEKAIETAGGPEAFEAGVARMIDELRGRVPVTPVRPARPAREDGDARLG